jgi:hypothetical protein
MSEPSIVADSDENTAAEPATPASRGGPWKLIALVAVLTVIAIVLVPGRESPPEGVTQAPSDATGSAPSLLSGEPAVDAISQAEPETPLPVAGVPAELPPGAAARALITALRTSMPPDLERAFAAAGEHQRAGRLEDAYPLYFYAAREGHGQAAMVLGQQADPRDFDAKGLFDEADPLQAHKWYTRARQAGVTGAGEALAALRTSIEAAAQNGDLEARRLTLQWK